MANALAHGCVRCGTDLVLWSNNKFVPGWAVSYDDHATLFNDFPPQIFVSFSGKTITMDMAASAVTNRFTTN